VKADIKIRNVSHVTNSGRAGIGFVIGNIVDNSNEKLFDHKIVLLENNDSTKYKDFKILKRKLNFIVRTSDLIHLHAAWNLILFIFKKIKTIPVIISPHGAFHPKSLQRSKLKKIIAKYLYVNQAHKNARCIHVFTIAEAKYIRSYGITKPSIAVIPNGIKIDEKLKFNTNLRNKLLNLANGKRIILSLSRLEEAKGIDILIDGYSEYRAGVKDSVLFIVGYGSDKYQTHLKNKIKKLKLEGNVFLLGKMDNEEKNTLYDVANIFILPSYNEGFSITVLEAFRQRLPVIATTGTPFSKIVEKKCGLYIKPSKKDIFNAFISYSKLSDQELASMGEKGYKWAAEEFDIKDVIAMYEELYSWILNDADQPDFIYDD
jgi:glycosyltransferase involved in cell wall biosynthesis